MVNRVILHAVKADLKFIGQKTDFPISSYPDAPGRAFRKQNNNLVALK